MGSGLEDGLMRGMCCFSQRDIAHAFLMQATLDERYLV